MRGIIDASQRKAATAVGWAYLAALVPAIFAEFYVRGRLVVAGDMARTAADVMAHERLFRLGIASNLVVFAIDVVLITALYVVLQPIHRRVALLALGWGLVETAILVLVTLADFDVLHILGSARYLEAFGADRLQALAGMSIAAHGTAYGVGLVFAGLRSTAYCSLWFRSGFVPKALAAWGVLASLLMGASAFAFIVFPELEIVVPVGLYGGPIFFFELTMGLWLVIKGVSNPSQTGPGSLAEGDR
jgi:hypothetical protein